MSIVKGADKKHGQPSRSSGNGVETDVADEQADGKRGDSKASQVLKLVALQQEELQALTSKLIVANQQLEVVQDARDRASQYMESTAPHKNPTSRTRAKIGDAALEVLEEVELKSKQALVVQHMESDPDFNELVWLAVSSEVTKDPKGFSKSKPGTVNLNTLFVESEKHEQSSAAKSTKFDAQDADLLWENLSGQLSLNNIEEDEYELVAAYDPLLVPKQMSDLRAECSELNDEITMLQKKKEQKASHDHSQPRSRRLALMRQKTKVLLHPSASNALEPLLQSAQGALVALQQQKDALSLRYQGDSLGKRRIEIRSDLGPTGSFAFAREEQQGDDRIDEALEIDETLQDEIEDAKAKVSDLSMEANELQRQVQTLRASLADPEGASARQKAASEARALQVRNERRASKLMMEEEAARAAVAIGEAARKPLLSSGSHAGKEAAAKNKAPKALTYKGSAKAVAKANTEEPQEVEPTAEALHSQGGAATKQALLKVRQENEEAKAKVEELKRQIQEATASRETTMGSTLDQQAERTQEQADSSSSSTRASPPSAATASGSAALPGATAQGQLRRQIHKDSLEDGEKEQKEDEKRDALESAGLTAVTAAVQQAGSSSAPNSISARNRRRPSGANAPPPAKTLKDLAREQKEAVKTPEEDEKQKKKLKENLQSMMALGAEKEQLEKDLQAMEEKVKAVKTNSKDAVVEQLLKEVRSDKKPESDRIKHLKSELKKGRGTVQKLRSAWQTTMHAGLGGPKRKVGGSGAVSQEAAINVVNRFRGVLQALRPKDTHQVVVSSASKFLSTIGVETTVREVPEEDVLQPSGESENEISAGLKAQEERSRASPPANEESGIRRPSAADFSRLMAGMHTGRRPSSIGVMTKRAGREANSPSSPGSRSSRGSMLNLIAKAKGTEHGEDDDEDGPDKPGAKASSTVRFLLKSTDAAFQGRPGSERGMKEDGLDKPSPQPMSPEVITEEDPNEQENASSSSNSESKGVVASAHRRPVRRTTPGSGLLANAGTAAAANMKLDEDEEQESGSET